MMNGKDFAKRLCDEYYGEDNYEPRKNKDYSKIKKWGTEVLDKCLNDKMYLLYHQFEYGEDNEHEKIKLLGIYSSEQEASKAIERYYKLAGFKEYPKEFFIIDEYVVNEDTYWKEGFVNTDDLDRDFEALTVCFNEWTGNNKDPYESWNDNKYYNVLCHINEVVYEIKDIGKLAEYIQKAWIQWIGDTSKNLDDYIEIAGNIISKRFYDKYD